MSDHILLSVDPGIRGCGAAVWRDKDLIGAAYVRSSCKTGNGPAAAAEMAKCVVDWAGPFGLLDALALEWPQTYGGRAARGDANDLFALAGVDGALAGMWLVAKVTHYLPREWKGTVDPEVLIRQVQSRVTEEEKRRVELPAPSLQHNVWDAVGIGLKCLGRLERKRVFPRE